MPCTKKMIQESESASKQEFIHGHFFGTVGVLIGNLTKIFCLLFSIQIHNGDKAICGWGGDESISHVVQILRDGFRAAVYLERCLFVLDRYFLTVSMLTEWEESRQYPEFIHIITRAKKNCIAYEQPKKYRGRGCRPVKGNSVHVHELFHSACVAFISARLPIYRKNKEVCYLSRINLWGQKLYQPLQFALVEYKAKQAILISTALTMSAEEIITAYSCRFKIETMYREFKQQFGGLFYHFWTKAVPKLNPYRRKNSPNPLSLVKDVAERTRVIQALKATESYVLFSSIAMGIVQILCLNYGNKLSVSAFRYLRTSSHQLVSEASMIKYLGRNLFRFMAKQDSLTITKIIFSRQIPVKQEDFDRLVSSANF